MFVTSINDTEGLSSKPGNYARGYISTDLLNQLFSHERWWTILFSHLVLFITTNSFLMNEDEQLSFSPLFRIHGSGEVLLHH